MRLDQAGLRQFRLGVSHPRDRIGIRLGRQAEQRVPDHDAGVIIGGVRELGTAGGIANCIDALVGGLEVVIDDNTVAVLFDAGGFKIERLQDRCPPGRDKKMTAGDNLTAVADRDFNIAGAALDPRNRAAGADHHAFARQLLQHNGRALRIVLGQRLRRF